MFTGFLQFIDDDKTIFRFKKEIKSEIDGARKKLKREDRIVWFLRNYKIALINHILKTKELTFEDNLSEEKYSKFELWAEKELKRYPYIKEDNYLTFSELSNFERNVEHFLSLPIPAIQSYTWNKQKDEEIFDYFLKLEDGWKETQKGKIRYTEQPLDEDVTVLIKFNDGFYWLDLERPYCDLEGKSMGHCGNSAARDGSVLSLRKLIKPSGNKDTWMWEPHATFIHSDEGYLGEMKGRNNEKVVAKYHPYIIELLKHKVTTSSKGTQSYFIKGLRGGGYKPEANFSLNDLSEELYDGLIEARPDLDTFSNRFKKEGLTEDLMKDLQEKNPLGTKLEFNENVVVIDTAKDLVGFMEEHGAKDRRGNSDAEYAAKIYSGEETLDFYESPNDSELEDIVSGWFDEDKLREYLVRILGEEKVTEWEDDNLNITDLIKEEAEELYDAIERSYSRGYDWGTSEEIGKAIKKALKDFEIITSSSYDDDVYGSCYILGEPHDEPIKIAMTVDKFCKLIDEHSANIEENGYKFKVEVNQPYYGWNNFDDRGVVESLDDDGYKHLLNTRALKKLGGE
jgi:hypothetical protein